MRIGLEVLLGKRTGMLRGARVGLICNPATVDRDFRHAADMFRAHAEIDLRAIYGPQHGIRGETQDNMIEWEGFEDPRTGVPAYSLYGEVRKPAAEMLEGVDLLVFDIQDVGTRVYTFIYTMALAMQAAREHGKRVIVLDRPNPITCNKMEGSLLVRGNESFVGMYPIPMRHGMTVAELALMFNGEFGVGCDLEVVPMEGYERKLWFDETDAPWVLPSPNMPTIETATVYPGAVFVEGTKLSEGRGTTRPFELIGAPYADGYEVAEFLEGLELPGACFRPHSFLPTFQKHAGEICHGVQIHVIDREAFRPVITGIAVIKAFHDLYGEKFRWQDPPYEYVYDRLPFDVIAGGSELRRQIESGASVAGISGSWEADEATFASMRSRYLLY
ncbi:MAG: DUF1343 domain-containing protein [Acidobacteriota bacterium]|nr:MAG: DUF1343 domain-containing protein [Acidobacteriota bacterium]